MPEPHRSQGALPRRAQVRRHGGARLRSPSRVQQCLAGCARRRRPRRGGFPRARRAGGKTRPARRLRGARLGPPCQRLPRRLGGRAPRRPSVGRARPRFLPYPGAQDRPDADAGDPQGPHLPGAARGRAAPRNGLSLLEPPLPLVSRPGRAAGRRLHGRAPGHRLRRASLARDLQRPLPRRIGTQRRDRRAALAGLHARRAAAPDRRRRSGPAGAAASRGVRRRRVRRVRDGRDRSRASSRSCSPGSASPRRASTSRRTSPAGARATSTSS